MGVEKVDLKSLFGPICREYHIPISNSGGWWDLNSRTGILVRMYLHWNEDGNIPVLLYCGDFDPGGLNISSFMRKNLRDMAGGAAYILRRDHGIKVTTEEMEAFVDDEIEIDRFGLNYDFIEANGLTWIDNLETGSGGDLGDRAHKDHHKPDVEDYIRQFGARKVEANALVVAPEAGRRLCLEAILKYVDADAPDEYKERLEEPREELQRAIYKRLVSASRPSPMTAARVPMMTAMRVLMTAMRVPMMTAAMICRRSRRRHHRGHASSSPSQPMMCRQYHPRGRASSSPGRAGG